MGTLGNMEMASAIFNGHAFTQYGPGQYTPELRRGAHGPEQHGPPQQRRGMGR
jgi:hypothetical protein